MRSGAETLSSSYQQAERRRFDPSSELPLTRLDELPDGVKLDVVVRSQTVPRPGPAVWINTLTLSALMFGCSSRSVVSKYLPPFLTSHAWFKPGVINKVQQNHNEYSGGAKPLLFMFSLAQ